MTKADRLYLIDGHALAYRAYFALTRGGDPARWMTTSGEPTAGTYGFTSVILRLLEQDSPEYLAVSFDVGKTFRDELFAEYKGTREKMPDDLRMQITFVVNDHHANVAAGLAFDPHRFAFDDVFQAG